MTFPHYFFRFDLNIVICNTVIKFYEEMQCLIYVPGIGSLKSFFFWGGGRIGEEGGWGRVKDLTKIIGKP